MPLDTEEMSRRFRAEAVDIEGCRVRVTNFRGTAQEFDLTEPPNCNGIGRIRHFRRATSPGWPENPLPIDPACRALRLPSLDVIRAQAFQSAVCNWRCWYCFVPFDLLRANTKHSALLSAAELIDLYLGQSNRPRVLDLTGGQPDLTPEWVPWTLRALRSRGLDKEVYVWSDDNLSNDYFWRYLSRDDVDFIAAYQNYGRVTCFKGFDPESFAFNTKAPAELFDRQFKLLDRLLDVGIDLYCYVTLTCPAVESIGPGVCRFLDRLQELDVNLPLRVVPLEVRIFTPVSQRLNVLTNSALKHQQIAIEVWQREMERRFCFAMRTLPICEVPLENRPKGS